MEQESREESATLRTEEEYDQAQKIIRILIDNGCIKSSSGIDEYIKDWEMAFSIVDIFNQQTNRRG